MNKFWVGLLCVAVLGLSDGCRKRRLFRDAPPPPAPDTTLRAPVQTDSLGLVSAPPLSVDPRLNVDQIDFNYLTARAKISFKSKDQDINNANVNLRIRKDSLIWLSVTGVGIEVARALITRDSILVLNKIHREYAVYDYPALSQRFNFHLTYDLLQSLIVGNLPLPQKPAQKIKNERDYLLLRQSEGKVMVENYIGEQNRKLKKLLLVEQPTKNSLKLDYDDFTTLNNFLFPYTSLVTVDYQSGSDGQFYQTLLRIQHNKVELSDKNPGFPFSIPPKYQRR